MLLAYFVEDWGIWPALSDALLGDPSCVWEYDDSMQSLLRRE